MWFIGKFFRWETFLQIYQARSASAVDTLIRFAQSAFGWTTMTECVVHEACRMAASSR
jgi:hypothetical protein